jgi:hypothetical protein
VTSGISISRAFESGDGRGAIAGFVGTVAGLSIAAGSALLLGAATSALAPVLIGVGIAGSLSVGAFHIGRHFGWWN